MDAVKKFGLTPEILCTTPRFKGYPGDYGEEIGYFPRENKPYILIDRASAYGAGIVCHGSSEAMQEHVANINPNFWKDYERDIERREKKLAVERAVKKREKMARWKARLKKRNEYRREIWTRREERERRKGNGAPFIEGVEDLGEDTDNESSSTLVSESDTDEIRDDDTQSDSKDVRSDAEQREPEATSSEDSDENDNFQRFVHEGFRYKAVMRVPWLNRKRRRDEWGFHCVRCEGRDQWPNHANRHFIMSTFREHFKECGPLSAGVHHIDDCCQKGTCRKRRENFYENIHPRPFWRC